PSPPARPARKIPGRFSPASCPAAPAADTMVVPCPDRKRSGGTEMTDYQIQPNTRRCALTGRDLQPGEKVYTALLEDGGKFLRQDYSSEAWQGPPAEAFSFWCGRVPAQEETRKPRIDDELLMD